jgi:hypothetical protein
MTAELLKDLGQIAGIGGIALGVFMLLFREVIRKKIFPTLTKKQGYWIILVSLFLIWSVALAGIIAWIMTSGNDSAATSSGQTYSVSASVWQVDLDSKGALVDSKTTPGITGQGVDDTSIKQLADWIISISGAKDPAESEPIAVEIDIPANLEQRDPVIRRIPDGPMDVMMWAVSGRGKLRLPLDVSTLKQLHQDFFLEIRVPGYASEALECKWGQSVQKRLELSPATVSLGIEQFENDTQGVSDRLIQVLSDHKGIKITSPDILKTIREEVLRHNEMIRRDPEIQKDLRKLGVDYIVSGNVRSQPATGT